MGKKKEKTVAELLREARKMQKARKKGVPVLLEDPDWGDGLRSLTWADLEDWAGAKIVPRGRSYKGRVSDVVKIANNLAMASVSGTRKYITQVGLEPNGELFSDCNCPYDWGPCKHAVALLLVCMDAIREGKEIPEASQNDERLLLFSRDAMDDADDEWDDWENENECAPAPDLRDSLAKMKKKDIVELLDGLASDFPDFHETIMDRIRVHTAGPGDAARVLRRQIQEITSFDDYGDYWDRGYSEPDFKKMRSTMRALLDKGHADQVVSLGMEFWESSHNLIESLDHEGEIAMEVGECMEVVFDAAPASGMSSRDRLAWMIDRFLEDQYDVLPDMEEALAEGDFSVKDWSHAAGSLAKRLSAMPVPSTGGAFNRSYERSNVLSWLIRALEESGQGGIIELLENEAPRTQEYARLVEALEDAGEHEKARQWAIKGFEDTLENAPGIAWDMVEKLQAMAERSKDHAQAAALSVLEFFAYPGIGKYLEMEKAGRKLKIWPEVREGLLAFLENGKRPDLAGSKRKSSTAWPLPEPWVSLPMEKGRKKDFPDHETLIDIAVHEKRHDDAIAQFEDMNKRSRWRAHSGLGLAAAVQKTHPDFSINIWKTEAERLINTVNVKAYLEAGKYLRKAKKVFEATGRADQWTAYVRTLREKNRRRPRMMDVLDSLENKPIMKS